MKEYIFLNDNTKVNIMWKAINNKWILINKKNVINQSNHFTDWIGRKVRLASSQSIYIVYSL